MPLTDAEVLKNNTDNDTPLRAIRILVWESNHRLSKRLEKCLNWRDDIKLLHYDEEAERLSYNSSLEADIALISTSILQQYGRDHSVWEPIKNIPVVWVGSINQNADAIISINNEEMVIPAFFNCSSLNTALRRTLRRSLHPLRNAYLELDDTSEKSCAETPVCKEGSFIYQATCMHELVEDSRLYGAFSVNVLIRGESGTGKEHIARIVADAHPQYRNGPFVAVNCAAIPDTLFESLFFGHMKGSFSGAVRDYAGHFRDANGGTLYLDEIGDLPFYQQIKLLRAIDGGVIHPVGSSEPIRSDFRLITATNRPLNHMIQNGTFRLDFYHRIAVVELYVPTLQERGINEKLLLFNAAMRRFMLHYARESCEPPELPKWLTRWVATHHFTGNVRELFNKAARMAVYYLRHHRFEQVKCMRLLCADTLQCESHGQEGLTDFSSQNEERNQIVEALEKNQWCKSKAAEALGWSRRTLWLKIKKYGLSA